MLTTARPEKLSICREYAPPARSRTGIHIFGRIRPRTDSAFLARCLLSSPHVLAPSQPVRGPQYVQRAFPCTLSPLRRCWRAGAPGEPLLRIAVRAARHPARCFLTLPPFACRRRLPTATAERKRLRTASLRRRCALSLETLAASRLKTYACHAARQLVAARYDTTPAAAAHR